MFRGKAPKRRGYYVAKEVLEYTKIALDGSNSGLWLGITDESSEGNYVYPSDGIAQKLSWTFHPSFSNSRSANCLYMHPGYVTSRKWMVQYSCSSNTLAAICEWVI